MRHASLIPNRQLIENAQISPFAIAQLSAPLIVLEVAMLLFLVLVRVIPVILDEVYAVQLSLVVYHVIAFQFARLAFFAHNLESIDECPQLIVVHVFVVPLRYLMELKKVAKLHLQCISCQQRNLAAFSWC